VLNLIIFVRLVINLYINKFRKLIPEQYERFTFWIPWADPWDYENTRGA